MKKSTFGIALFALVAALFVTAAPANAQSIDFRVGGYDYGYGYGRGRSGVSVDIHIGNGRHYPRGPVYRDRGCYPDYDCGPVYRAPRDCRHYDGCGHRDYYRPSSIQVLVIDYVPAYDRWGHCIGERRVERWVTAYWDNHRGGYWYTNRAGRYVRAQ